ncbi:MAG TPA: TonB C-terminal domain-containing protein [Polyangia bacterium]
MISLLLHLNVVAPLVIAAWVYGGREEAQRAEEMDVAFQEADQTALPPDLPPIEPTPETLEPEAKKAPKPEKKRPELVKVPKPQKQKKAEAEKKEKPEPEVVVPPLPPMPPPPPPEHKAHEKIVDLDNDKDMPPPPDAKYLAQKNNRAEVETRARDTNMVANQKGEEAQASSPSNRQDTAVGGEKEKIAQLEEQKSKLGRAAPDVTPHLNPELAQPKDEPDHRDKSLLALRNPTPKQHELTPETADLSLPHAADGEMPLPSHAVRGNKSDPSHLTDAKRVKLALSAKDYEYLFGADAAAERKLAQQARSTHQGKFEKRLARVKSAVENFIPEVKPGNQTALNTRAAPFAAFIARMHRSIHELWGFGQLEEWEEKPGSSPFNNQNLVTELEIVLNGDGTVDRVGVVRGSGLTAYDVAAVDVVYSAGPYPEPPRAIRSGNGKIYLHWHFHRDGRQCSPAFADPYILENAGATDDKPTALDVPRPIHVAGISPPTSAGGDGPRRLQRLDDDNPAHRAKRAAMEREVATADGPGAGAEPGLGERGPAGRAEPADPPAAPPNANDPAAQATALRWFTALAAGDTARLLDLAAFPFKTNGKDVAKKSDLSTMLTDLAGEGIRRPSTVQVVTAARLRSAIGKLPASLDDSSGGQLYSVIEIGKDEMLILILGQRGGGAWRPVGMVRR